MKYAIKMSAAAERARQWLEEQMLRVFGVTHPLLNMWCIWKAPDDEDIYDPFYECRVKDYLLSENEATLVLELYDEEKVLEEQRVRLLGPMSRRFLANAKRLYKHGDGIGTVIEKAFQDAMAESIKEEKRRVAKAQAHFDEAKTKVSVYTAKIVAERVQGATRTLTTIQREKKMKIRSL